jgi:aminopeptidase N
LSTYLNNQFKNKKAPDARRAFPCFDEPAFKATFDITIIAEKDKTVLSNMVS